MSINRLWDQSIYWHRFNVIFFLPSGKFITFLDVLYCKSCVFTGGWLAGSKQSNVVLAEERGRSFWYNPPKVLRQKRLEMERDVHQWYFFQISAERSQKPGFAGGENVRLILIMGCLLPRDS